MSSLAASGIAAGPSFAAIATVMVGRARLASGPGPCRHRRRGYPNVPKAAARFESAVLPKRTRLSMETRKLFARLYLEGLSSGDSEPVFRQLLGETAPLSANTVLRIKEEWQTEDEAWRGRPLENERFLYVWADGIYLGAGLEKEKGCLLTLLGASADGSKDLIAMELGYRESKTSWADVLRGLGARGLRAPLLLICLLYTSPSPRDLSTSRMPSSA